MYGKIRRNGKKRKEHGKNGGTGYRENKRGVREGGTGGRMKEK